MEKETKSYLQLMIYAILAGSVGIAVRMIPTMEATTILFFRALIGALFILCLVIFQKKLADLKPQHYKKTLLIGILQTVSMVLYFYAITKTSIANALFLLYTAPLFSLLIARIFLHERIERRTLIGTGTTFLGILLLIDPAHFSFSNEATIGNILGLGAGFFYAAMGMTAKSLRKEVSGSYLAFYELSILFLVLLVSLFFTGGFSIHEIIPNWPLLLYIGIGTSGIAFTLFMHAIAHIPAQKVFVMTSLEPLAGTVLAGLFFHEIPSITSNVGIVGILIGIYLVTAKIK